MSYQTIRNFKKIPEMLGFDGEYSAGHPETKFWRFSGKICKISAVKHFKRTAILLNFVNLSATFCPRFELFWKKTFKDF